MAWHHSHYRTTVVVPPPPTATQGPARRRLLGATLTQLACCYYCNSTPIAALAWATKAPTRSHHDGQRYLRVTSQSPSAIATDDVGQPPLLIIPGTAQSIELWEPHIPFFAQTRRVVLVCEPLGVGTQVPDSADLSLPSQADILHRTLQSLEENADNSDRSSGVPYDVVGFSLGGRIAMALACRYPEMVHRLHLTGVCRRRSDWGNLQICAWKDILDTAAAASASGESTNGGNLRPFAWVALLASYSTEFLTAQKDRLPQWIDGVCQRHTVEGLRKLIHQTHREEEDSSDTNEWSVAAMAVRLAAQAREGRLCVGEHDRLAPPSEVKALASILQWPLPTVIAGSAHVPPVENPRDWRHNVEDFFAH